MPSLPDGATFAELPAALSNPSTFEKADDDLKRWLQNERPLTILKSPTLKEVSKPGEDERSFRIRLTQLAREARDEKKKALRERYQKKLDALHKRIRTAEERVDREASQASQRKLDTVVNVGTGLLGGFARRWTPFERRPDWHRRAKCWPCTKRVAGCRPCGGSPQ